MMISWLLFCALQIDSMDRQDDTEAPVVHAAWTDEPVAVDGRLDDAVWHEAARNALTMTRGQLGAGQTIQESGSALVAYDSDNLYIAFEFVDSDVVQESEKDQQRHFMTGDLAELFLKPVDQTWYWEFYATPNNLRSSFFFPGGGRFALPSAYDYQTRMRVAARVQGTLNHWRDKDQGWTAEVMIPLNELADMGEPLTTEHQWSILFGRYNYSRYLDQAELSMFPSLSVMRFHNVHEYARLVLDPPAPQPSDSDSDY